MAKTAGPTRQQIETDIRKKQFAPIYLLMGEESFYIDRIADMILKNALTEEEKDFNLTTYYAPTPQWQTWCWHAAATR